MSKELPRSVLTSSLMMLMMSKEMTSVTFNVPRKIGEFLIFQQSVNSEDPSIIALTCPIHEILCSLRDVT